MKGIQAYDFKDLFLKTFALRPPELPSINPTILLIFVPTSAQGSFQY